MFVSLGRTTSSSKTPAEALQRAPPKPVAGLSSGRGGATLGLAPVRLPIRRRELSAGRAAHSNCSNSKCSSGPSGPPLGALWGRLVSAQANDRRPARRLEGRQIRCSTRHLAHLSAGAWLQLARLARWASSAGAAKLSGGRQRERLCVGRPNRSGGTAATRREKRKTTTTACHLSRLWASSPSELGDNLASLCLFNFMQPYSEL